MPAMSGAEASRRIKQAEVPFTYVILTSSYRDAEESPSFDGSLADRFLSKRYLLNELRRAVEEAVRIACERRAAH
jgi:CheY-like chemotaxis protein